MDLFEVLKLKPDCTREDVDKSYLKSEKNAEIEFAWKVLRDPYYRLVYRKYKSMEIINKAGFFKDNLDMDDKDFYKLNLLTTPCKKLIKKKNPVVLLSTGGFFPIHKGHIHMMELARESIEKEGYSVVGGYLSPSHDSYMITKPYCNQNLSERIYKCKEVLEDHPWLQIDSFESQYMRTYVNFTEIIERLEQYLKKHYDNNISVAYVFGSDNAGFAYCFEDKGLAVCIERENYQEEYNKMKAKIISRNVVFVNNKSDKAKLCSRDIRKQMLLRKEPPSGGLFMIRDEGIEPLKHLSKVAKEEVHQAQTIFIKQLSQLFKETLYADVKIVKVSDQIKYADERLKDKNTISLDSYYNGTNNLRVSRLFHLSDIQIKYDKMVTSEKNDVSQIISRVKAGRYILVDDDSVSGNTIRSIKEQLPKGVEIEDIFLLSSYMKKKTI